MIFRWVTILSLHYKADLSKEEVKIYIDALRGYDAKRLDEAFYRCRNECEYMPRIADVVKRMPEPEQYGSGADYGVFVPASDHLEPFSDTHNLRVYVDAKGFKKVKYEAIGAAGKARNTVADPQLQITWGEAWKRINDIGKEKTLK